MLAYPQGGCMKPLLTHNMTHKLVTVRQNVRAAEALELMKSHGFRHLPVLDDKGEYIVGMLSDRDLLKSSQPEVTVSNLMSVPILFFDIATPMLAVATAMVDKKVSAFLVTNNGEVEGIVTSEDLLVLLAEILSEDSSAKWILGEFLVNPKSQRNFNGMTSAARI